jgi:alkylhydroperoxidase family enzyme
VIRHGTEGETQVLKKEIQNHASTNEINGNHSIIIPGAMEALQSLAKAAEQSGVPKKKTLDLVHLRASQINGCSVCFDMGLRFKKGRRTRQTNACSQSLLASWAWRLCSAKADQSSNESGQV